MSDIERRMEDLERRVALLEATSSTAGRLNYACPTGTTNESSVDRSRSLVTVEISNKRYDPANPNAGSYEDHIWFDCLYVPQSLSKPTRAIKGLLEFADHFGEVKFRIQITLNETLTPGKPLPQLGIGFTYNQFLEEHKWMFGTKVQDMVCALQLTNVLYADVLVTPSPERNRCRTRQLRRMHLIATAVLTTCLLLSNDASAQKTYTPAQLRSMVQNGTYPKQGRTSTETQSTDYVACIKTVESMLSSVRPHYPTQTIVSTNIMRVEKLWTNDAAMTFTCSAPDRKLIITTAPYL